MSIRTTKVQKIRRRIRDAIRVAKRRGYSIVPNETLSQKRACCCPLAAVVVAHSRLTPNVPVDEDNVINRAKAILRLKDIQINQFIDAFDCPTHHEVRGKYDAFAVELREELENGNL